MMKRIVWGISYFGIVLIALGIHGITNAQDSGEPEEKGAESDSAVATAPAPALLDRDFNGKSLEDVEGAKFHKQEKGRPAKLEDGRLILCDGAGNQHNAVGFRVVERDQRFRRVDASFTLNMSSSMHGMSIAMLATSRFGNGGPAFEMYKAKPLGEDRPKFPEWDEPELWGSLAVAFDSHNPPSEDPFDEWGNVHQRGQHEVSIHWDGREIRNALSAVNFADGGDHKVSVSAHFVTGGAEITVKIGDSAVYDKEFIPHILPFAHRFALGARGESNGAHCAIDDLRCVAYQRCDRFQGPLTIATFESEWMVKKSKINKTRSRERFDLLPSEVSAERIIMTYTLQPMVKRDEWDRLAAVYVYDDEGTRFELARVLTPFMLWGESYTWHIDVTPYAHLLRGSRELELMAGANVGEGFAIDLSFSYYKRPAGVPQLPKVIGLKNLWTGSINFAKGKRENWPSAKTQSIPEGTERAIVRVCATGHGKQEFRPSPRTMTVNGTSYENTLWTTDAYLNPYRPQFGTWKYDRAGWGPGSIGRIWEVDISEHLEGAQKLEFQYTPEDFEHSGWATHVIESYVVYYAE